jgi:hypothetical protein
MNQKGKITFLSLIALLIIVYGGFAAVKLIGSSLADKHIEKAVIEELGTARGSYFSSEMGEDIVRKILKDNHVIFDENDEGAVEVNMNQKKGTIEFYYRYKVEINLIFFKKMKTVEVRSEVAAYA